MIWEHLRHSGRRWRTAELLVTLWLALMLIMPAAWVVLELTKYKIHVATGNTHIHVNGTRVAARDGYERRFQEGFAHALEEAVRGTTHPCTPPCSPA